MLAMPEERILYGQSFIKAPNHVFMIAMPEERILYGQSFIKAPDHVFLMIEIRALYGQSFVKAPNHIFTIEIRKDACQKKKHCTANYLPKHPTTSL